MLREAMRALRVTDMEYAPEICDYLCAAEKDLKMAGIVIDGTCDFVITEETDPLDPSSTVCSVTDNSTITDAAVKIAMITYVRAHFGTPPDYDKLAASYDLQRRQLANATGYTDFYEEPEEEDPSPAAQDDTGGAGTDDTGDAGTDGTGTEGTDDAGNAEEADGQ